MGKYAPSQRTFSGAVRAVIIEGAVFNIVVTWFQHRQLHHAYCSFIVPAMIGMAAQTLDVSVGTLDIDADLIVVRYWMGSGDQAMCVRNPRHDSCR
jgi:hypothetical protein